jgi:hypothetical protein
MSNILHKYSALHSLKEQRKQLIKDLEAVTLAINALELPKRISDVNPDHYNEAVAMAVLEYTHKFTLEEKIFYVLGKIGAGDAVDISNYILLIDKTIKNDKRVYDRITFYASKMYRNGLIDAVKQGRRNLYKAK